MHLSKMVFQWERNAELVGGDGSTLLHRDFICEGGEEIGSGWDANSLLIYNCRQSS